MDQCHAHNLSQPPPPSKPYGIRVSIRANDSFARLLGPGWQAHHWFVSAAQRDRALRDMASEHLYSRRGDRPTLRFEPVDAPSNEAAD